MKLIRLEQKFGRGIRKEETLGKCIKGCVVDDGAAVMDSVGTWCRTLGPAHISAQNSEDGFDCQITFVIVKDSEEDRFDHCARRVPSGYMKEQWDWHEDHALAIGKTA